MTWWNDLPPERQQLIEQVLSKRQVEVLSATMDGHSTLVIARSLKLAEPTVRMHLERALSKMAPHLQSKEPA